MQALSLALEDGSLHGRPVLYRLPGLGAIQEQTYAAAADFCEVRELPWDDATRERAFVTPTRHSRVLDMRDFAFDPRFREVPMIDYFLAELGCAPDSVVGARKRNTWLRPRLRLPQRAAHPPGYVLLCPRASMPLRDMPAGFHAALAGWLAEALGRPVLTQGEAVARAQAVPPAESLAELAALVAGAALVVSTDTAMLHLADAFDVPCLAFFVTHAPERRVRDYPRCVALRFPAPSLPEALEFARDAADVAAAAAAWPAFPDVRERLSGLLAAWPGLSRP